MVRFVSVMTLAVLLAACDAGAPGSGAPEPTASASTASASAAATASASATAQAGSRIGGARKVTEETDDYIFEYAYPATAGKIDSLGDLLDAELEKARTDMARDSAEARRQTREDGFPYNKHSYQGSWSVVADLPGFISLSHEWSTYTGGAHGIYGVRSLVWDKLANRQMQAIDLFTSPRALEQSLGNRFCEGLNRERRNKGIQPPEDDSVFTVCPNIDELIVLVGSSDKRHFNRITLYAGHYVAGPYVEGAYEVHLNVDRKMLAAVKPEYRDSFRTRN